MSVDYKVEQQRLIWQIATQRCSVEQNKYAIMDLVFKVKRNKINIDLAEKDLVNKNESDNSLCSELEKQKIRSYVASQKAMIERQKLENLEIADRLDRHKENINASLKAIESFNKSLVDLNKEYGPIEDEEYNSYLLGN